MSRLGISSSIPNSTSRPVALLGLLAALLLGGDVRLTAPFSHDFPIGDGGLFLLMARAVADNNFALPATIGYPTIGPEIPFCYPPLAFYLAAFAHFLGVPFETILRFSPALWATASIYAFWRLARTLLRTLPEGEIAVAIATPLWALFPWSFLWLVMGGGLTRAPGLFFALLGVEAAIRLWRDRENRALIQTTLLFALCILTHLERAHFLAFSLLLCCAVYGRDRRSWTQLGAIFVGAAALSAPWWALCLARFGLQPFLASFHSGGSAWPPQLWANLSNSEYFFPLVTLVALVGAALFARKVPLLPLWMALILMSEARSPRHFITIPLAMAAALAVAQVRPRILRVASAAILSCWLGIQAASIASGYRALSATQRDAMKWTKFHTSPGARFVVIHAQGWADPWFDLEAEWFPALARRRSLNTIQGSEWLPGGAFDRQIERYKTLSLARTPQKMKRALQHFDARPDYFYIVTSEAEIPANARGAAIPAGLLQAFSDLKLQRVYSNRGAQIWRRNSN